MMLLPAFVGAPEPGRVYHCDAVTLLRAMPSGSVDCIITDPPYPREYLHLYEDIAREARRVLKSGGSLLAMCGQSYFPQILAMMLPYLSYQWIVNYSMLGGEAAQIWNRHVITFWKPVLWLTNGTYDGEWKSDVVKSAGNDKQYHHWGQSVSGMSGLVSRFSNVGDLVVDPFVGGGTTLYACMLHQRRYIGCDISLEHVELARKRLAQPYTPSMFTAPTVTEPQAEQAPLFAAVSE